MQLSPLNHLTMTKDIYVRIMFTLPGLIYLKTVAPTSILLLQQYSSFSFISWLIYTQPVITAWDWLHHIASCQLCCSLSTSTSRQPSLSASTSEQPFWKWIVRCQLSFQTCVLNIGTLLGWLNFWFAAVDICSMHLEKKTAYKQLFIALYYTKLFACSIR